METPSELFQHGIFTENSDIRAHVGVIAKKIFVFPTQSGRSAIEEHCNTEMIKRAWQPGVAGHTAEGYLVKLEWIKDLRVIEPTLNWWEGWTEQLSTTEKGRRAVEVVCSALKAGRFPLWLDGVNDERENIQISGTDIVIFARKKIQVKCDFKAGPATIPGCFGNLFLQSTERNPLKFH